MAVRATEQTPTSLHDFVPEQTVLVRNVPPFEPAWEFVMGSAVGGKNVIEHTNPLDRRDYGALEFTAGLQRHFYRYGKVAVGTDLTYDGAAGAKVDIVEGSSVQWRPGPGQWLAIGLYGGYEHVIERFGALVQAGYSVARGFEDPTSPRFYMRYGWRYYLNDRFWGVFAIRSIEGRRADFLEVGAGYRIIKRPRTVGDQRFESGTSGRHGLCVFPRYSAA